MYSFVICFEDMILTLAKSDSSFNCAYKLSIDENGLLVLGENKEFVILLDSVDLSYYENYKLFYEEKCKEFLKRLYSYELSNDDKNIYVFGVV